MNHANPAQLSDDPLLHHVWDQLGRPRGCAVTGGWVRDRLLGRDSGDLDLTIRGNADKVGRTVRRLSKALGVRAHLLGAAPHRIWRIDTQRLKIEIWPLGGLSPEEDILRRDFACNALSWELPDGPLVDLAGGLDDIDHRRFRAISRTNLEDDPVRLLRGPRFLAQLPNFDLDDQTRSWIRQLAPTLADAPRERVGQELLNILRACAAGRGLRECLGLGLFGPAAPDADSVDRVWIEKNLDAVGALSQRFQAGPTPSPHQAEHHADEDVPLTANPKRAANRTALLAWLFRAWGLPTDNRLASYAWQQDDRDNALRAAQLLDEALSTVDAPAADRRELAWRAGAASPALIALGSALSPAKPGWRRWWRQWQRNAGALTDPRPLLTGIEIAEITGTEPGPELGSIAKDLLRAQVRGKLRTRGGAVQWLEDSIRSQRQ
jgi:tRNA nucleotidyltransferase (CCA-adding enzyme)